MSSNHQLVTSVLGFRVSVSSLWCIWSLGLSTTAVKVWQNCPELVSCSEVPGQAFVLAPCWESSFSSLLKVSLTKERPSGGTKVTKQPYKLNGTVLVAISLPWVVNHSVCRGEVYVVCAQSATTSKLWEGSKRVGGVGGLLSPFSDSWSTSKGPVYDIRSRHFCWLNWELWSRVLFGRWEQVFTAE